MKTGFIGLGIMGRPMALNLLAAGHELFVLASSGAAEELAGAGARLCADAAEVAALSEVVIMIVPDTPQVEEVLFASRGVVEGLGAGKLVIDMSSISPIATKDFAARVAEAGAGYLDAPVSGGEVGAKTASLTIMVGGSEADFARARPLFEAIGKNITHVGPVGDGQTTKVANQIIVALNIAAVGEALLFARKAGADPARVREALLGGFASSRVLEVHGQRMIERTFAPGFRIDLHHKDLALALDGGNRLGMPLPQTAFCQQLLNIARGAGNGGLDHSGIVTALEQIAGSSLQRD